MHIQIGKSPDFKMTRGRELLSYKAVIDVSGSGSMIRRSAISSFSLIMLCKALRELQVIHRVDQRTRLFLDQENSICLKFEAVNHAVKVKIQIPLSPGMNATQLGEITEFIRNIFQTIPGSR